MKVEVIIFMLIIASCFACQNLVWWVISQFLTYWIIYCVLIYDRNPFYNRVDLHVSALILARGGSKSIPLKNLAKVGGVSLLETSLNEILKVNEFSSVWVSTDYIEIYKEALKFKSKSDGYNLKLIFKKF